MKPISDKIYAKIIATGSYSPKKILHNRDFAKILDTSDEWIQTRTGIKQRCFVSKGEKTSDLAVNAAKNALQSIDLKANQLDMLIVATTTPDLLLPATAVIVADKLGIQSIACFDLHSACSGFIYALSVANSFIASNRAKRVMVIGSESMSKLIDMKDRSTCVLFGDGAGAFILQASKDVGIIDTKLNSMPKYINLLNSEKMNGGDEFLRMKGKEVFKIAVSELGNMAPQILKENGFKPDDLDWFVPHQANIRIIEAVRKKLKLPQSKVIITIDRFGNTSAASIAQAYDFANKQGQFNKGDLILLEAFGAGFSWGSVLLRV